MLSYWEKESLIHYDIAIIGSGIVGLSSAISIKEKYPDKSVVVFERGILPSGASTRNAGFTTFGGVSELLQDLKTMPEADVFDLVSKRWQGLQILRERLGDDKIDFKNQGGYEFIFHNENIEKEDVARINQFLYPLFKTEVFSINNNYIKEFGFNSNFIKHCIYNPFEGQLHTGKMMKALIEMALQSGVQIITGAEVMGIENKGSFVEVEVENISLKNSIQIKADQCVVCTNAFAGKFFPDMDITPGRGQVLITEPIPGLPFKGIFHFDEGFYYFRDIDQRILFGGGRNLDFENEKTTDIALNETIQQKLDYYLGNLIIPNIPYKVDIRWSGIMAFGKQKTPIIQKVDDRILAGVRMNGVGVALGSLVGKEISELV